MIPVEYKSSEIEKYFKSNRIKWEQFYPSERHIIETLNLNSSSKVLDLGCGCAGLGCALKERFGVFDYTGIDINKQAVETAKVLLPNANLHHCDFLNIDVEHIKFNGFDHVFSLSCIDWNDGFHKTLPRAFSYVKEGGWLILSLRLTKEKSVYDSKSSFQYINYDGKREGETATYVVLNTIEIVDYFKKMNPSEIRGFGYWGQVGNHTVTPYSEICFSVFAVKKKLPEEYNEQAHLNLELPQDILDYLKS
jgi:ubiquinone/menaquinone biosynthesis C-methylase UbiE